jgi:hypothetical protein
MSEEDAGRIEWERQQGQISPGSLDWYRDRLSDTTFQRDWPEQWASLKSSIDRALSGSGQSLDTAPDGRSTPRQIHDARFGVSYDGDRVTLPAPLQAAIDNDGGADPHDTAQALSAIGLNYKATYEAAARLLALVGSKVQASTLSASALANLATYAEHLARHSAQRPS